MLGANVGVRVRALAVTFAVIAAVSPVAFLALGVPDAAAQASTTATPAPLYLAEGNTLPGWKQFITILNPSVSETATVSVQYACEEPAGTKVSCGITGDAVTRTIAPLARDTIQVFDPAQGGVNGVFTGVGTTIRSNIAVIAERPMYMEQPAGAFSQIPAVVRGATDARAVQPSSIWYLPEGTTQPEFQTYLTILNPQTDTVLATITYSVEGSTAPVVKTRSLPGSSRTTIDVVDPASPGSLGQKVSGVSMIVSSPAESPIVVERPLYFDHNFGGALGVVNGATAKAGARFSQTSPGSLTFAEGNGLPDFEQFFTVLNTENRAGTLTISYLVEGLTSPVVRTCALPALARATINVSSLNSAGAFQSCALGRENAGTAVSKGVGAVLSADVAIAAERPMYFVRDFPEIGLTNGGHDVFGVADPQEASNEFFFAEGSTRSGFDQFWTIANPNANSIDVTVEYYFQAGTRANESLTYTVPANSRRTVQVFNPADNGVGREFDFGARAFSDGPLFSIERPFYTKRAIAGIPTDDGHDIPGASPQEVFGERFPQVTLAKAADRDFAFEGEEITFTLTVGNSGAGEAQGAQARDEIPSGAGFVRASEGTLVTSTMTPTVVFAVGDIAPGDSVTRTIVLTGTVGTLTNTAIAFSTNGTGEAVEATATVEVVPAQMMLGAVMTGPQEVSSSVTAPPVGDPDGNGDATFTIDAALGTVGYDIDVTDVALPATGAHIHRGATGTVGPIVVNFNAPDATGHVEGTATAPSSILYEILHNPEGFYANVHTTEYPGGAIRGQLGEVEAGEWSGQSEGPAIPCATTCTTLVTGTITSTVDNEVDPASYTGTLTFDNTSGCRPTSGELTFTVTGGDTFFGTVDPERSSFCDDSGVFLVLNVNGGTGIFDQFNITALFRLSGVSTGTGLATQEGSGVFVIQSADFG